ncbi:MAG: hypothetical protein NZM04_10160 [Methylacidiphilales bacterium]|nr:hypothetical protein [Candidatus Methylacidiphilales bacterium]
MPHPKLDHHTHNTIFNPSLDTHTSEAHKPVLFAHPTPLPNPSATRMMKL